MAFLIVGLGNPSPDYDGTRHNLGLAVVDAWLAAHETFHLAQAPGTNANLWRGIAHGQEVIVTPSLGVYMNASGPAVTRLLQYFKIPPANLILVHDELALPLGRLRLDRNISSAGHNGVQSVIEALGTPDFVRLRLGVESRPDHNVPSEDFVLQKFSAGEQIIASDMISQAMAALTSLLAHGPERTMTEYNRADVGIDNSNQLG